MGSRPKYTCPYCNIKKRVKSNFDEHIAWCKILHLPTTGEHDILSFDKIPTISELFVLVKHLVKENATLKTDVEKIKSLQYRNYRRHFNDWLQLPQNRCPTTFDDWFNGILISMDHLQQIFDHDYVTGFKTCLMDAMHEHVNHLPVKCFTQKPNAFYIYTTNKWVIMNTELFTKYMKKLADRIFKKYMEWEETQESVLIQDPSFQDKLFSYARKVNDPFSSRHTISIVQKWWFSQLSKSMPNIIEYQME